MHKPVNLTPFRPFFRAVTLRYLHRPLECDDLVSARVGAPALMEPYFFSAIWPDSSAVLYFTNMK